MHRLSILTSLVVAVLVCTAAAAAGPYPVEFSARMVQSMPDNKRATGRIYVGKGQLRTEMGQGDELRIMIMDTKQQIAWMLNPERKEYLEMKGPAGKTTGANRPALPGEPGSACGKKKGVACKMLGLETVNGRRAEKWEITMSRGKQSASSVVWVDRSIAMPVREELPGGFVRELQDIREGPQPVSLFQVPQDYKRVEMPAQSTRARGAQKEAPPAGR